MKKNLIKLAVIGIALLALIQLIPVKRINPDVTADIQAPENVKSILRKSCYDCHSNETKWPFYSYIAPLSWLVALDVHGGRKHLNFSDWGSYSEAKQVALKINIIEEVSEGEMPPARYLIAHGDTRLSAEQIAVLNAWTAK